MYPIPCDFQLTFASFYFVQKKMNRKLDWFDDENLVKADKWNKVCILKHMFTLEELEADPTLLLDLKEDIREECEKVGEVTNVIIYDVSTLSHLYMFCCCSFYAVIHRCFSYIFFPAFSITPREWCQ